MRKTIVEEAYGIDGFELRVFILFVQTDVICPCGIIDAALEKCRLCASLELHDKPLSVHSFADDVKLRLFALRRVLSLLSVKILFDVLHLRFLRQDIVQQPDQ